jgi:hypothetical protein
MGKVIVVPGQNDLATTHPELAREWDYTRNEGMSPLTTYGGVRAKFFWKCKVGHSFEASKHSSPRLKTRGDFDVWGAR